MRRASQESRSACGLDQLVSWTACPGRAKNILVGENVIMTLSNVRGGWRQGQSLWGENKDKVRDVKGGGTLGFKKLNRLWHVEFCLEGDSR